jgi:hypothetical protein
MAIYSNTNRTSGASSATPSWELYTSANARARLLELTVVMGAATASLISLGRPAAMGVGQTTPVRGQAEDGADPASQSQTALAWGTTAPTAPTVFFRRFNLPATIGAGRVCTFPRGLVIPISFSVVLWNQGTNGVTDVDAVWDE